MWPRPKESFLVLLILFFPRSFAQGAGGCTKISYCRQFIEVDKSLTISNKAECKYGQKAAPQEEAECKEACEPEGAANDCMCVSKEDSIKGKEGESASLMLMSIPFFAGSLVHCALSAYSFRNDYTGCMKCYASLAAVILSILGIGLVVAGSMLDTNEYWYGCGAPLKKE